MHCSPLNSPPCDSTAIFECCLHLPTNVYVLTGGSGRLRKEEASDEDEDTEYFDAMEDSPAFITVTATENTQHRSVVHRDPYFFYSAKQQDNRKTDAWMKVQLSFNI